MSTVWVPGEIDSTGQLTIDPDQMVSGADDDDESGFLGFSRAEKGARLRKRIQRLEQKESKLSDSGPADLYQAAAASGAVQENQFEGLGSTSIAASGTGSLTDTVNRNIWGKSMVLDSDSPSDVLVTAITIAGLPFQIGTKGTPLSMFATNSTRYGISFGRKLALVGQQIVVNLTNIDTGSGHNVLGGMIVDELNPYMAAVWMERMLLSAAVATSSGAQFAS